MILRDSARGLPGFVLVALVAIVVTVIACQKEAGADCGGLTMCSYPMECVSGVRGSTTKTCVRPCDKCPGQDAPGFPPSLRMLGCCPRGLTCEKVGTDGYCLPDRR